MFLMSPPGAARLSLPHRLRKKAPALLSARFHAAQVSFPPVTALRLGFFFCLPLGHLLVQLFRSRSPRVSQHGFCPFLQGNLPVPVFPVSSSIEIKREDPESDTNVVPFINLNKLNPQKSGMEGKKRKSVLSRTRSKSAVKRGNKRDADA